MNALSDILGHLSPAAAYTVVAAAVLAESVLLVGAFVPTLTLLLIAGALARTGHVNLLLVIAAAAGAVVAGDFLAHRTGRYLGDRLRGGHMGRRVPDAAWGRAETLMMRHGGRAVFVARFVPVVRTLAPHSAGPPACPTGASLRTVSSPLACGPQRKRVSDTPPRPRCSASSRWAVPPSPWSL
ncbi:DedA family protein [Streptomyces phaeochromogenes]|uniref:DedA family protein n=1 Tax=Streptomyces phaeochromogenes TaxID=1923 RepID=UPI0038660249|nr:VTT domain-containing protein [Streptomyces phaeochromogenes]